ncbi:conserved hypothetical protein [Vibrio chagasii]|nr:conserved hypothetical protein [Vibrio chagasii]
MDNAYIIGNTILVDLDDVTAHFGEYISSRLSMRSGVKCGIEDYLTYEFNKYHDLGYDDFIDEVIISEAFRVIQPISGSIEALAKFRELGYKVRIVTSRGAFKNALKDTTNWLNLHGATYDSIDVVNPNVESKSDIYRKYKHEGIAALIDDASHNLYDALATGYVSQAICITKPWNKDESRFVEGHTRFSKMLDFALHLEAIQKINSASVA